MHASRLYLLIVGQMFAVLANVSCSEPRSGSDPQEGAAADTAPEIVDNDIAVSVDADADSSEVCPVCQTMSATEGCLADPDGADCSVGGRGQGTATHQCSGGKCVAVCPGGDGCPCETNVDCDSSLCTYGTRDGLRRCAGSCEASGQCPDGFDCISNIRSRVFSACIDTQLARCLPCRTDGDCAVYGATGDTRGFRCASFDGRYRCLRPCGKHACDDGTCTKLLTQEDGELATYCVPGAGKDLGCPCTQFAVVTGAIGSCNRPTDKCVGQFRCKQQTSRSGATTAVATPCEATQGVPCDA